MPSTSYTRPVSRAATALLLLSAALISPTSAAGLRTMKSAGCYSSSTPLKDQGSNIYQSSGACQPICVDLDFAVMAMTEGSNCLCGDMLPSEDSKVSDDKCDTPCDGYDKEMCGGHNYFSVFLSGTKNNVDSYAGDESSSSSSASAPASSTTAAPSSSTTKAPNAGAVSTSIAPGTTVVVTMPSSQQQTESPDAASANRSDGGSSTNVAGIAAGVVVGVVAIAGIGIGLFFFMRHRKRKAEEEEFKRTQVGDFMRHGGTSGEGKPPNTGYSNMSDSRLDPEANKRNSTGSIADNQDYSRRILRVANPDDH